MLQHVSTTSSITGSALDRMLARAIRVRLFMAPALGSLSLTFAYFEPTRWRRVLLACAVTLLLSLSYVEFVRYRKLGLSAVQVPLNIMLTIVGQLCLVTGSGGLFSPVIPALIVVHLITALLDRRSARWLLFLIVPYFWLLACVHHFRWPVRSLLPALFGDAHLIELGPAPWLAVGLFTLMLVATGRIGGALQQVFESLFNEAVRERDRSLALHAEQSRTLTLLTSEIAHELKNPLASVKGLAALVSKDVQGRAAERMQVLRGEVDRMQSILDEFLNLSRPLVPLSVAETNLGELVREVATLHEGSASERGVHIEVEGPNLAALRCDQRKVRQVLINLLQNALEVSPRGSLVTMRVESASQGLRVQILDRGPGLSEALMERVFEAGVTNKEHGSGIGLVVARSLARQHGGEVELRPREGGGLVANLLLPLTPNAALAASARAKSDAHEVQP